MAQMVDIRRYDRPPWLPTKVKAVAVNRISTKTKQNVKYMRMPHDASCDIYFDPYNCLQHYVNEKVERYSYVAPACMFFWDSGHLAVAQHDQVMLPRWRSGRVMGTGVENSWNGRMKWPQVPSCPLLYNHNDPLAAHVCGWLSPEGSPFSHEMR